MGFNVDWATSFLALVNLAQLTLLAWLRLEQRRVKSELQELNGHVERRLSGLEGHRRRM